MKKTCIIPFLLIPAVIFAANDDMADQYFSKKELVLTKQERSALSIAKKWQTGSATSKPVAAKDGAVSFVYGSGQIQILTAVLQVTDVVLEPGEQFNNFNVGDPRFEIEPAITGIGGSQQIHFLIKPLDVGLDTSLVVTTDRRTYHFHLRSSRKAFMPYVSFIYPDSVQAKWDAMRVKETVERRLNTLPQTGEYLGNLNFNYYVSGPSRLKPCRVYNDGVKTIIEMQKTIKQREAPTLLILRSRRLFRKAEKVMVNYRLQQNRYIVDSVFDKAILIVGTGASQERVTIIRRK